MEFSLMNIGAVIVGGVAGSATGDMLALEGKWKGRLTKGRVIAMYGLVGALGLFAPGLLKDKIGSVPPTFVYLLGAYCLGVAYSEYSGV